MRKVKRPTQSTLETYRTCIRGVTNADLKTRLERVEVTVMCESGLYETAATEGRLHTLARSKSVDGLVTVEEMSKLYDGRFSRRGSAGRKIYDALLNAAPNERCPLCGQGVVSTLDHYLPQSRYPCLTITPSNLIPACFDCNKKKLNRFPATEDEATLNPYFDDVERDPWLGAEVLEGQPVAVRFFVRRVSYWGELMQARVERHFETLKLAALYSSNAADELQNLRLDLWRIFQSGGSEGVRNELRDKAESRAEAHVNSWQTATYQALAKSDWYCAGGFERASG
jgi:hypothetical protein